MIIVVYFLSFLLWFFFPFTLLYFVLYSFSSTHSFLLSPFPSTGHKAMGRGQRAQRGEKERTTVHQTLYVSVHQSIRPSVRPSPSWSAGKYVEDIRGAQTDSEIAGGEAVRAMVGWEATTHDFYYHLITRSHKPHSMTNKENVVH